MGNVSVLIHTLEKAVNQDSVPSLVVVTENAMKVPSPANALMASRVLHVIFKIAQINALIMVNVFFLKTLQPQ